MEIAIQQLRREGDFLQIKNRNLHLYVSEFLAQQKAKEPKKNKLEPDEFIFML